MTDYRAACAALLLVGMTAANPAAAADLVLAKSEASALAESNAGKPYWSLQAQCAGVFGAGYGYEINMGRLEAANANRALGVAMMSDSIARLQSDRGLDRQAAIATATPELEYGRTSANAMLDKDGAGPESEWNYTRSACLDIASAYRNRSQR